MKSPLQQTKNFNKHNSITNIFLSPQNGETDGNKDMKNNNQKDFKNGE